MLRGKPTMDLSKVDARPWVPAKTRAWSDAIRDGDVVTCRRLMNEGLSPDTLTERGFPALSEALRDRKEAVAFLLVERGANPNALDPFQWSPLYYATTTQDGAQCTRFVRLLLDAGVDLHFVPAQPKADYCIPLLHVVRSIGDELEIYQMLHAAGADMVYVPENPPKGYLTPFQELVSRDCVDAVRFFVEECGHDPAQRTLAGRTLMQVGSQSPEVKAYLRALKTAATVVEAVDAGRSTESPQSRSRGMSPL